MNWVECMISGIIHKNDARFLPCEHVNMSSCHEDHLFACRVRVLYIGHCWTSNSGGNLSFDQSMLKL